MSPETAPTELRSDIIVAAEVGAAYVQRKLFGPMQRYPGSLARGENIEANIHDLWSLATPPEEDTSAKIWRLGQLGLDIRDVSSAVRMLRQCRSSTITVEQFHGVTSALHRFHRVYSAETLAMRALLGCMKQLFPAPDSAGPQVKRQRRIEALSKKQPRRIRAAPCSSEHGCASTK